MAEEVEQARGSATLLDVLLFVSAHFQVEGNACLGLCQQTWSDRLLWRSLIEMRHLFKLANGEVLMTSTRVVIAIVKFRLANVQRLVDLGANIEAKCDRGMTALRWASILRNEQLVHFLLDRHADIETRDNNGITPLANASLHGNVAMIELLLSRSANIEAKDDNGCTALVFACIKGHVPAVTLMLDRHADIETRSNIGKSPLMFASEFGHVPVIELLLSRSANIEAEDDKGYTALTIACIKGLVPAATLLLDSHADIETRSNNGFTPLMFASQYGHVPVIELLCNRHAAIDALNNNNNMSALTVACICAHVDAVRMLLTRGANADLGTPPIIFIACSDAGKPESNSDADVATFWARRCEIVSELIRQRLAHVLANGQAALHEARHNEQPAIVAMLEEALND